MIPSLNGPSLARQSIRSSRTSQAALAALPPGTVQPTATEEHLPDSDWTEAGATLSEEEAPVGTFSGSLTYEEFIEHGKEEMESPWMCLHENEKTTFCKVTVFFSIEISNMSCFLKKIGAGYYFPCSSFLFAKIGKFFPSLCPPLVDIFFLPWPT